VKAGEVHISGSTAIGGAILAEEDVALTGSIHVGGPVKAQDFTSRGRFEIGGPIEAQDVDIRLAGHSKAPSIKAQDIEVRRGERNGELTVETIEGEDVYLEATRAGLVRGNSVHLGPYCTVRVVEAEELEVHETSTFKERRSRSAGT
jgi:cytoskeletal protein CcmA (bactofilin family)